MINKKTIIAGMIGLAVGIGAMIPALQYQHRKKIETLFILESLVMFIDKTPECLNALENM